MKPIPRACLALLAVVMLGGCITSQIDRAQYIKNGTQYGVTKGRFRGRWWNYYERGRSFADGEFWAEAEKDFRIALAGRSRDQLWPRTYGLHFVREYFPHRELGVTLYHQGRVEEAIEELEASLDQQKSARAAYFLDEVRKVWIEARDADADPPTIEILSPAPSDVLGAMSVCVKGVARDDTFVKEVAVGGESFPVYVSAPELPFEQEVALAPGANDIEIVVTDLMGRTAKTTVSTRSDVDGPALSFDGPVVVPGRVSGVAFDSAGVAGVRIAGKSADLTPTGDGLAEFSIDVAREDLAAPVWYEGEDTLGNITRGNLGRNLPEQAILLPWDEPPVVFAADGPRLVPLTSRLHALVVGGQVLALTAVTDADRTPGKADVRFANLREGQKYFRNEIVATVDIDAPSPVAKAEINGAPLDTIPGRAVQHLARRIPLEPGPNPLTALAEDVDGNQGQAAVAIERELTTVEEISAKLNVAILGNVWEGNSPLLEGEAQLIVSMLTSELDQFSRFKLVDRSLLPEALSELQLSAALGDRDERLALGKIVPAEIMLIGKVHRDAESIEIMLHAVSTETTILLAHADVAGSADNSAELRGLVRDLALRIAQEFPRVQGQVAYVRNPQVFITNLSAAHRVRESMKFIVFRYGPEITDPKTHASLGRDTEIIAEALVQAVDSSKSVAERLALEEEEEVLPIEVGNEVVTK